MKIQKLSETATSSYSCLTDLTTGIISSRCLVAHHPRLSKTLTFAQWKLFDKCRSVQDSSNKSNSQKILHRFSCNSIIRDYVVTIQKTWGGGWLHLHSGINQQTNKHIAGMGKFPKNPGSLPVIPAEVGLVWSFGSRCFFLGPFIPLKTQGVWKPRVINLSIGKHILTMFSRGPIFFVCAAYVFSLFWGFLKPPHPTSTEIAKKTLTVQLRESPISQWITWQQNTSLIAM